MSDGLKSKIIRVAIPSPLRRHFDYLAPNGTSDDLLPGMRVRIPFGKRKLVAVVTDVGVSSDCPPSKLRVIESILDAQPILSKTDLDLLRWASQYYQHPLGEVISNALPGLLRKGGAASVTQETIWVLPKVVDEAKVATLSRAPRQQQLYEKLKLHPDGLGRDDFTDGFPDELGDWRSTLRTLEKKGLIETSTRKLEDAPLSKTAAPILGDDQRLAVERIHQQNDGFVRHLLHGITGSGKTEVYLHAIEPILEQGKQALILVPEISLTPQTVARFQQRLGLRVAALHSGLNDRKRLDSWLNASTGEASVIIGTRSAVFVPMKNPGLIVVDEEHDLSLKQQDGFRYNARDVAVYRAQQLNIPIVLGSATPSMESLFNVAQGRYQLSTLPQRVSGSQLPDIHLIDVRSLPLSDGISQPVLDKIAQTTARGEQVLLFLNRRGYAPVLMCHGCGWISQCGRCDARMTLHQRRKILACHHCGREARVPTQCPDCRGDELHHLGQGTERIEAGLRKVFPTLQIARIDRDTVRRHSDFTETLKRIHAKEIQILIGTQMLAKGHDFPGITLVAILDTDQGLFGADYRSAERMAQLISQVSGRAGRGAKKGEVVIQTHHPEHPLLQTLLSQGYTGLSQTLLKERELAMLPPYSSQALLRADATDANDPMAFLEQARQQLMKMTECNLQIWGPVPAPMERRAGRYRAQLLLQGTQRPELRKTLSQWIPQLESLPLSRKIRWSIDVDPMEML